MGYEITLPVRQHFAFFKRVNPQTWLESYKLPRSNLVAGASALALHSGTGNRKHACLQHLVVSLQLIVMHVGRQAILLGTVTASDNPEPVVRRQEEGDD